MAQSKSIAIIGSSSAAGTGVDTSWAARLSLSGYSVTNLALASITIDVGTPTWLGLPTVDTNRNATKVRSLHPDYAVINFPSNGYDAMSVTDILRKIRITYHHIDSAGIYTFVTTTQPRNGFSPTERDKLRIVKDSIIAEYGAHALDFWTILAQPPSWTIKTIYNLDGTHPNQAGHNELFKIIYNALQFVGINAGSDITTLLSTISGQYTVSGLKPGRYSLVMSLYDSLGNAISDTVSIFRDTQVTVVPPPPPVSTSGVVKVNVYGGTNPYNATDWNNWVAPALSPVFKYSDGSSSTIRAQLSGQSGIAENAAPYAPIMAPPEVIRYASYSTSNRTLTISGLDNSKVYDIELYASRKGISNNTTRFSIGTSFIDIITDNNLGNKATFTSISPSSGSITVTISRLATYNYLNGFTITERSIPVQSAHRNTAESTFAGLSLIRAPVGTIRTLVTDMSGKTVINTSDTNVRLSGLAKGMYIITFISSTGKKSAKLLL